MKKHLRSLLAACLAVCLCVCFGLFAVACKDDKNDNNDGGNNNSTPPPATVEVTGVTLDHSTLALTVGDTATLVATVAPANATNRTVTWTSSAPALVSVSTTGVVTAVAPTTNPVTVTATTANNKTATCAVTVAAAQQTPQDPAEEALSVGVNQLNVEEATGLKCKLTVATSGSYTFNVTTDAANEFTVAVVGDEANAQTYGNGASFEVTLTKNVEYHFVITKGANNKDGNFSVEIISSVYALGDIVSVSTLNNAYAITDGYIEAPVAIAAAGDYKIEGSTNLEAVTCTVSVYVNGSATAICSSDATGALSYTYTVAEGDITNGVVKFKFAFTDLAQAGEVYFWAKVTAAQPEEEEGKFYTVGTPVTSDENADDAESVSINDSANGGNTCLVYRFKITEAGTYTVSFADSMGLGYIAAVANITADAGVYEIPSGSYKTDGLTADSIEVTLAAGDILSVFVQYSDETITVTKKA